MNIIFKNEVDILLLWDIYVKAKLSEKYSFSYSIGMIWTQPVGVIVLIFTWRFWLAIKSETGSTVPALIGNNQLVEDANLPPWLKIWSRDYLALWGMPDA